MVLLKDPEGDLTQFEDVIFEEIYSDINSPSIFIAKSEEDLLAKIIVLDGHSTLLVYTASEDLPWEAYNELGAYKYQPDKIGDGLIIFPHSFYYEFDLNLSTHKLGVDASFDGSGIKALTMPMKAVKIENIVDALRDRISSALSTIFKSVDDQIDLTAGKRIKIPKKISSSIGLKLALLGINLDKINIVSSSQIDKVEKEVVEKIYEEPPTKMKAILKEEEKEKKKSKRKKSIELRKKVARATKVSVPKLKKSVSKSSPKPAPAPTTASAPAPSAGVTPPPGAGAGGGPPPPSGTGGGLPQPTPHAASPAGGLPPMPSPSPTPRKEGSKMDIPEIEPMEMVKGEEEEELEDTADFDDDLLPSEMKKEDRLTMRYTHASYFERMVPNRAYPLLIKISTEEMKVKKSVSSIVSGEKLSEKAETLILSETTPILTIKPEFPGCFVVPETIDVDVSNDNVKAQFYITPIALGNLHASVKFIQNNKIVHSMGLETKVITHRLSRWAALLGAAASTIPAGLAFILNEQPKDFMDERLDTFAPDLKQYGLMIPGSLTVIFLAISGFMYWFRRPSKTSRSVAFPG